MSVQERFVSGPTKTIRVPSGDQLPSEPKRATRRRPLPSDRTIHNPRAVYATQRPRGDHEGSRCSSRIPGVNFRVESAKRSISQMSSLEPDWYAIRPGSPGYEPEAVSVETAQHRKQATN